MRLFLQTALLIALLHADPSPLQSAAPDAELGIAYFEQHIRPLLSKRCYSCHAARSRKSEGGLTLDARTGWETGGDNGPAVVPGDVEASLLIRAVRYTDPDLQMPPDNPLSPDEVARLEQWIRLGAIDPRDEAVAPEDSAQAPPSDPLAGREHWAYRPLSRSAPPQVEDVTWPRSTVDAFILAPLEAAHLQPAPPADRRTLARRVYFQLIGLPPTTEQLAAFVEDERPDAYEQLVDQLLDSPHFGERWGRHWLDLARYADSNGLDENFLFREAWRYRNWVIAAINADLPFDEFLTQQIAGDLLPFDSIAQRDQQRIAAGFLVVGPKVLLGIDADQQRMDVADEQIDTIAKAVLGQTLGCARCHDHKFDPIPTADYYALAGIMTSTQVMQQRYMLNQQRVMEQLVGLGPEGDELNEAYEHYWRNQSRLKERVKRAESALELLEQGDAEAISKFITEHADAIAEEAQDDAQPLAERIETQKAFAAELKATLDASPAIPPRAMVPGERETPADEHIRIAGQVDHPGDQVPRGFLQVLCDEATVRPAAQSGRLELSHWLTDVDHGAGHLAARVLANRVWHHLLGVGIVRTVDNFGRTGEAPSHPELLDELAGELIESGWSLKQLVRSVVLSRTFQMSSQHDNSAHALDPENRLLWRAYRRRLDPESFRDAMLTAAGTLDLTPLDSTVWYLGDQATAVGENKNRRRTDFPCRSVYLPVIRNDLPELFDVFDFADPHATTGMRAQTMVATQGLFVLNDDSVMSAAQAVAEQIGAGSADADDEERLKRLYERMLNGGGSDDEGATLLRFVRDMRMHLADSGAGDADLRAWSMAAHALFASSRFQILE